jgi:hypothetical protein
MTHDSANNPTNANATRPDSGKPSVAIEPRESLWRRFAYKFWGYDFFVSYNWTSGGPYAVSLAERLRDRGYDCFLDQSEFAAGDDWRKEAQKALRNTQRLVVVATRDAIVKSEAVRHEIELFTRRCERVIPVVFGARFSENEKRQLPTLQKIPDSTIDIVEDVTRLEKGPSEEVLTQLIQAHRVVRRRSVRALVLAAAMAVLATASVVASIFWGLAALARNDAEAARIEEQRQKRLAKSAALVNKADLLRETEGSKLEESLKHAVDAYENSRLAGGSTDEARRAIQQALELMPERIGAPWLPFGKPAPVRMRATDQQLVLLREDPRQDNEAFALVVELDGDTEQWRVVQEFTKGEHGELVTNQYGQPIETPDNPRWLLTRKPGQVIVWDVTKGAPAIQLPFEHAPGDDDGFELLAINSGAEHAVVRRGRELTVWSLAGSPQQSVVLPVQYRLALYAISSSGERVAWALQNEFVVWSIKDGKKALNFPITGGGGHAESLRFIEGPSYHRDQAIFVSWSANQVAAMAPMARRSAPSHQAGIWKLGLNRNPGNQESEETPPDITQVRANPFEILFGGGTSEFSLAILDPANPVQWLDMESLISFTLGGAAGPGTKARFGDNVILIVHTDGTARLWDVHSRQESLRFTVKDGAIEDSSFLTIRPGNKTRALAVVTLDTRGYLQGWTSKRGPDRVETLINGG